MLFGNSLLVLIRILFFFDIHLVVGWSSILVTMKLLLEIPLQIIVLLEGFVCFTLLMLFGEIHIFLIVFLYVLLVVSRLTRDLSLTPSISHRPFSSFLHLPNFFAQDSFDFPLNAFFGFSFFTSVLLFFKECCYLLF